MSTTTKNYGLIKPELTDPADITAINENWDKLDEHSHESFNHNVSMEGNRISNVAEPIQGSDVATRDFVENHTVAGNTYVAVDYNNDGNVTIKPYVPGEDFVPVQGVINKQLEQNANITCCIRPNSLGLPGIHSIVAISFAIPVAENKEWVWDEIHLFYGSNCFAYDHKSLGSHLQNNTKGIEGIEEIPDDANALNIRCEFKYDDTGELIIIFENTYPSVARCSVSVVPICGKITYLA